MHRRFLSYMMQSLSQPANHNCRNDFGRGQCCTSEASLPVSGIPDSPLSCFLPLRRLLPLAGAAAAVRAAADALCEALSCSATSADESRWSRRAAMSSATCSAGAAWHREAQKALPAGGFCRSSMATLAGPSLPSAPTLHWTDCRLGNCL